MIDSATIEKILDAADIIEVIGEFVQLRRRGSNYIGLCPFHNEKTPSFTVSPSKQIFKCFGCGIAGNVISFLKEHEKLDYPNALIFLAKKYNIPIQEREITQEEIDAKKITESLAIVNEFAHQYFMDILHNNPEGKSIGLSYLKERNIRPDIIKRFQLGFATSSFNGLTNAAKAKGYKTDFLVKLGLSSKKNDKLFDKFRERIIFPIHSLSGKVIAFGGRILKKDEKTAKYLNSPESELYTKGNNLYGLYFAKKSIISKDKCYLVEGYTDVLGFAQAGIDNVVASQGTALTKNQIRLIHRFTKNLTIVYDGDNAGIKAATRGFDLILEQGMNVKIILLPEGEDPDSLSHKWNSSKLIEFLNDNETDFIHFKTNLLLQDNNNNDPYKRSQVINEILHTISLIPDRITRTLYITNTAKRLNIDEETLYRSLQQIFYKKQKKINRPENQSEKKVIPEIPLFISDTYAHPQEKELIRLLLKYGNKKFDYISTNKEGKEIVTELVVGEFIISSIRSDNLHPEFNNIYFKQIFEDYANGKTDKKYFINHENDEIRKLTANLLSQEIPISKIFNKKGNYTIPEEKRLNEIVISALVLYKRKVLEIYRKKILEEIEQLQNNPEILNEKISNLIKVNNVIQALSDKYGWVIF